MALYNGRTGAVVELSPEAYKTAAHVLDRLRNGPVPLQSLGRSPVLAHLVAGGFVLDVEMDELELLEKQYELERRRSNFLLTILPTFACNLACEYCFVARKKGRMNRNVVDQIIRFVADYLNSHPVSGLSVDWLGGEPLLAAATINRLSSKFLQLCQTRGIPYSAQVITNGTLLTSDAVAALQKAGVKRLQVTVDGPPHIHDGRRVIRRGNGPSFAAILAGIGRAMGKFNIRLRINVDSRNLHSIWSLLEILDKQGWLGPATGFYPYLGRVSPFTEVCAAVQTYMCQIEAFAEAQYEWWQRLDQLGVPVALQPLYQFPEPRPYNCSAVGANGFVFLPSGEIHKCGLSIGDRAEAIGQLGEPIDDNSVNYARWKGYSPFKEPTCRTCTFLPTCLGGCPRNRLLRRDREVRENCAYYQRFELEVVRHHLLLSRLSRRGR